METHDILFLLRAWRYCRQHGYGKELAAKVDPRFTPLEVAVAQQLFVSLSAYRKLDLFFSEGSDTRGSGKGGTPYLPLDTINIWWFLTYFVPYKSLGNLGAMSDFIKSHLDILWFVYIFNESKERHDDDWLCVYGKSSREPMYLRRFVNKNFHDMP